MTIEFCLGFRTVLKMGPQKKRLRGVEIYYGEVVDLVKITHQNSRQETIHETVSAINND